MAADRQVRQGDFALCDRAAVGEDEPPRFARRRAPGDGPAVLGGDARLDRPLRRGGIAARGGDKRSVEASHERARQAARAGLLDETGEAFARLGLRTRGQAQRREQRQLGLAGDDGASPRDVPPLGRYAGGGGEGVDLARVGRAQPRHVRGNVGFRQDQRRARAEARAVGDRQGSAVDRIVAGVDERAPDLARPRHRAGRARRRARRG